MSSSEVSPRSEPGGLTPNSLCKDARRCSSVGWCRSGFEPVGEMDIVAACSLKGKLFVLSTRKPREQSLWMKVLRLNKGAFSNSAAVSTACVASDAERTPKKLSLPLVCLPV